MSQIIDAIATASFYPGDVLCALPKFTVENSSIIDEENRRFAHTTLFNTMILSNQLIAVSKILKGDALTVNFNQFMFEVSKPFKATGDDSEMVMGFACLSQAEKHVMYKFADDAVRDAALEEGFIPACGEDAVETRRDPLTCNIIASAKRKLAAGTTVFRSNGLKVPFALKNTVAMEDGSHLRLTGGTEFLAHSCEPNVCILFDGTTIIGEALRPIAKGETLTYNYLTTEWELQCPFKCTCGCSPSSCFGNINGFKSLDLAKQMQLLSRASGLIRSQFVSTNPGADLPLRQDFTSVSSEVNGVFRATAVRAASAGTVLMHAEGARIEGQSLRFANTVLPHSSNSTTVFVEGRIVAFRDLAVGDALTINLNLMQYKLDEPFSYFDEEAQKEVEVKGFSGYDGDEMDRLMHVAEPSVRSAATDAGYAIRSSSEYVVVKPNGEMGQATFAAKPIEAGKKFFQTGGIVLPYPTMYTILLDETRHLLFAGGAQCLAHTCDPNVQILVHPEEGTFECLALRDIAADELISFNYLTTEWDMNTPFACLCGAAQCFQKIAGYRHLTAAGRAAIRDQTSPAMIRMLEASSKSEESPVRGDRVNKEAVMLWSVRTEMKRQDAAFRFVTTTPIEEGTVILSNLKDESSIKIEAGHVIIAGVKVSHSDLSNTVLVEGRVVAQKDIMEGEELTINMNYFVYDLIAKFGEELCRASGAIGFKHIPEAEKQRFLYLVEPDVRAEAMNDGWIVVATNDSLIIRPNGNMGQTAYAAEDIPTNTTLFHATGLVVPFITMYTICVGRDRHLLFGDGAECIAHHCEPNVKVAVNPDNTFDFVTISDIKKGDLVTFNYNTTEFGMNSPFDCLCGAVKCAKYIHGFEHLSESDKERLWPIASQWVKDQCHPIVTPEFRVRVRQH